MTSVGKSQTPFEKIIDSTPVNFVKDNKAVSLIGTAGITTVAYQVADKSQIGNAIIKKGAIPIAGAGITAVGLAMIHDGVTNDKRSKTERVGLISGGTGVTLGGTEIVGRALGIKELQPVTSIVIKPIKKVAEFISEHPDALGQSMMLVAPLAISAGSVYHMKKDGIGIANSVALGASSTYATFGLSTMVKGEERAAKTAGIVGGASLGLVSYAFAKEAKNSFEKNKTETGLAYSLASVASAVGSAHVLGEMSGIPALSNLAGKMFKNPVLAGGIAATGVALGAYYAYSHKPEEKKN